MHDAGKRLIEAVGRLATAWTGKRRPSPSPAPAAVLLGDVKPRLELLIAAVLGQQISIRTAQPGAPVSWPRRLWVPSITPSTPLVLPANDGAIVYLPASLPLAAPSGGLVQADAYCLLALLQAMRCVRGSAVQFARCETALTADLYLLAETAAADHGLRLLLPGWSQALDALYGAAGKEMARRHPRGEQEAEVAALYAAFLQGAMSLLPAENSAVASLAWARAYAEALRNRHHRERYRPWLGDQVVGRLLPPVPGQTQDGPAADPARQPPISALPQKRHNALLARHSRGRIPTKDQNGTSCRIGTVEIYDPHLHTENDHDLQQSKNAGGGGAMPDTTDTAKMVDARLSPPPGHAPLHAYPHVASPPRQDITASSLEDTPAICYPEWDFQSNSYREDAVRVHACPAPEGPTEWADKVLIRHTGMLHDMRRRLGTLRPDRQVLKRQIEGEELDCDALVGERSERCAGVAPPGAIYQSRRPAPRRIGLVLLIDASASTEAAISGRVRIIDVEKEAALVAASALDAAHADFAVLAFSGEGPDGVQVREIKGFDSPWHAGSQRRIAGLQPDRYTRLGAALRHASALLLRRPVDHRLLLLFSDGRPNDCDRYASYYGIEDARQAILETRLQHLSPYCFTVDREGSAYLPTLFGPGHYTIVQHPQQLPLAFIEWLRQAARRYQT